MGRKPLPSQERKPGRTILLALGRYHYLTLEQIRRYCGFRNYEYAKLNVRRLASDGFVFNRNYLPVRNGVNAGRPCVVSLTEKGKDYLIRSGHHPQAVVHKSYERSEPFLAHIHDLNDVLIALDHFALLTEGFELRAFLHDLVLKHYAPQVLMPDGSTKVVVPDSYVAIQYPDGSVSGVIVELDRGTESLADPYQKTTWTDKIARLRALASGPYEELFGFAGLRVTVVVRSIRKTSPRRMEDLLKWTELLLQDESEWGELFLFTTADPTAMSPEAFVTGKHWVKPFSRENVSLVEWPAV